MTTVDRERHQRGLVCPVGARLDVPYWKTSDLPLLSRTPQSVFPTPQYVIPAKVGIQKAWSGPWIPAFAGMTWEARSALTPN
ncbi:MAG: hypothetical protein DIKNOCCD_03202 [bacterium]|nr:hypothetical protein [bacterium]